MSDSKNTCRVCRGESTEEQPLLHPCKCRGSIKYIHQDCLLEWLKHSNKSTSKCDICNTPYKFRTIYDPEMPKTIPILFVCGQLFKILSNSFRKGLSIFLYTICLVLQIPVFWKFVGRSFTWIVDNSLPKGSPSFIDAVLFGSLDFLKYTLPSDPVKLFMFKARKFMSCTYFSGIRYIMVYAIVHLALFIEHEWVVRDEGYSKILLKKIGKEPRTKLVDMLRQALTTLRNESGDGNTEANINLQRIEMIARAINDLQESPDNNNSEHEGLLRGALEQRVQDGDAHDERNDEDVRNIRLEANREDEVEGNGNTRAAMNAFDDVGRNREQNEAQAELSDDSSESINQQGSFEGPARPNDGINQGNEDNLNNDNNANNADAANEVPINGGAGEILEILGINLKVSTPILLMVISDIVVIVYLVVTYLIPQVCGKFFFSVLNILVGVLDFLSQGKLTWSFLISKLQEYDVEKKLTSTGVAMFDFPVYVVINSYIKPVGQTFQHLVIDSNLQEPSMLERSILLVTGYSMVAWAVHRFMDSLASGKKPIVGASRKVYKILFEIAATTKVFLVFAIEIFFFPLYCGWLLDFCIAPIFLEKFLTGNEDGSISYMLLASSSVEVLKIHYIRILIYWFIGTLYMLNFALFIGMIRHDILRPGVLFFIRSPDDPNVRLIHDAMSKPLKLQLSRIYLSAKVYFAFIVFGIGGVSWGLRYLFDSSKQSNGNMLFPLSFLTFWVVPFFFFFMKNYSYKKQLLTDYCIKYWSRVFEISSSKLRLSHFILGKQVPQERGRIVCRNVLHHVIGNTTPNYSCPVTYKRAMEIFKENSDVNACFIPDGNYVRVPDNDTVSRKFIGKLFVPVTKDDQLLSPSESNMPETENEYSSEEENELDDAYTVVYQPPNFKLRCLTLVLMLWIFSLILILGILFGALLSGGSLKMIASKSIGYFLLGYKADVVSSWGFDIKSIETLLHGINLEVFFLMLLDKVIKKSEHERGNINEAEEEVAFEGNWLLPFVRVDMRFGRGDFVKEVLILSGIFLRASWVSLTHYVCIDLPLRKYLNSTITLGLLGQPNLLLSKLSFAIHLAVSFWTVLRNVVIMTYDIFYLLRNQVSIGDQFKMLVLPVFSDYIFIFTPGFLYLVSSNPSEVRNLFNSNQVNITQGNVKFWTFSLALYVLIMLLSDGQLLLNKLRDRVKNEKYVRGRTIENFDET